MVDEKNDVPDAVMKLGYADLPPKRIGVSIPISKEVITSMNNHQMTNFLRAGVYAVQEEIFALLINMAFLLMLTLYLMPVVYLTLIGNPS